MQRFDYCNNNYYCALSLLDCKNYSIRCALVGVVVAAVVAAADISQLHLLHSLFTAIYARFLVVQLNRFALGWVTTTTLCHRATLRPLHSAADVRDCSLRC